MPMLMYRKKSAVELVVLVELVKWGKVGKVVEIDCEKSMKLESD